MEVVDIIHLYWELRTKRDNLEVTLDEMLMLKDSTNFDEKICLDLARLVGAISQRLNVADKKFPWLQKTKNPFDTYR